MNLKTLTMAILLTAGSLSLTACRDSDVAFGAGVVVGVIVSDDHHHHHHSPNPPRYRGRRYYSVQNELTNMTPVQRVSVKYGLSMEQAELLTNHLLRTQAGDLSAMAELGFEKTDLEAIFEGRNPSASTLETLGARLNLDVSQAHQLIQDIKADAMKARETLM